MGFLEIRFPTDIGYGSKGGPGYNTTVVETAGGDESRNQNWSYARYVFDVAYGVKTIPQLESLIKMFHVAGGKENGFRFKDRLDFKSCDYDSVIARTNCTIGTGDGVIAAWQVVKTYTYSGYTRTRRILKLVSATLLVEVNGVLKTETTHYTVNYNTGIITFTGGNIPAAGHLIKCGFEFDVPVRFEIDELPILLENYRIGSASVPLVELKTGT